MVQKKVVHLSTFRPEQCGIASWTEDVINYSIKEKPNLINRVIAMNVSRKSSEYTDFVDFTIEKNRRDDYLVAAGHINGDDSTNLVSIQHEFGIFGGHEGDYLIEFLDRLKKPTIMTCHTVPRREETDKKSMDRREVLSKILPRVDKIISISNTAKKILENEYNIPSKKIRMIYHGTHKFEETTEEAKKIIGNLEGRFVLSTVGLVRRKRGMEQVIRALPKVVNEHPEILYHIAGKTHPKEKEGEREPYREQLMKEVKDLGLEEHVRFTDHFLPLNSLLRNIQASDLGITPYGTIGQISSGVMSYFIGLNKPVISTPFLYAQEILADGRGILLPDFNNPDTISKSLLDVLDHPSELLNIRKKITPFKSQMEWPNVARAYIEEEEKLMNSTI